MTDWKEHTDCYIKRLGELDGEQAYHSLIEADDGIIPILIDERICQILGDINKAQALGYQIPAAFLDELRKASGRQK